MMLLSDCEEYIPDRTDKNRRPHTLWENQDVKRLFWKEATCPKAAMARPRRSAHFLKQGLPFVSMMVAGSVGLSFLLQGRSASLFPVQLLRMGTEELHVLPAALLPRSSCSIQTDSGGASYAPGDLALLCFYSERTWRR